MLLKVHGEGCAAVRTWPKPQVRSPGVASSLKSLSSPSPGCRVTWSSLRMARRLQELQGANPHSTFRRLSDCPNKFTL